eukprot:TRINITY_DN358_c0_g1_i1.p1 TRINITY_DN358_c0_g1~~TRINITY_DN358_c0_g1_i1.p1  ORF type:complete len:712 (+),score=139.21 TRINITY_DN358_c0_g1_i1:84-2219(+)
MELFKGDLIQVAPVSESKTLCVLPIGKKKRQKVVVGDDLANVTCFEVRKNDIHTVFSHSGDKQHKINCVTTGGPIGNKNRIMFSQNNRVEGITKTGKNFFSFQTSLAEAIHTLDVEDKRMWIGGEFVYNSFNDCKDESFYMAPDKINAMCMANITRETEYDAILGCQDKYVRVIQGSKCVFDTVLDGSVACLRDFSSSTVKENGVLYGTGNGNIGRLLCQNTGVRREWRICNTESLGGVTTMVAADLTQDGCNDIALGRDDGLIQVYGFGMGDPVLQFDCSLGETVQSIDVGHINSPVYQDLVVCGYSGNVVSFTSENAVGVSEEYGQDKASKLRDNRMNKIQKDLEKLRENIKREREKLTKYADDFIPMNKQFSAKASLGLDAESCTNKLTIEIPVTMDSVVLRSDVSIALDIDDQAGIVSISPQNDGCFMATIRCVEPTSRLEVPIRTVEGQQGALEVFIISNTSTKTAQLERVAIKPLCMHQRIQTAAPDVPLSTLRVVGAFEMPLLHSWIASCLPEVPERTPSGDENILHFRNVFVHSTLVCKYRRGEALFSSDSASTLSILKELITREATARKVTVSTKIQMNPDSAPHILNLLKPRLLHQVKLLKQVSLLEALKEIAKKEETDVFLNSGYKETLDNESKIQSEMKRHPFISHMLFGVVTDLFVDVMKLANRNPRPLVPRVHHMLESYKTDEDHEALVQMFVTEQE